MCEKEIQNDIRKYRRKLERKRKEKESDLDEGGERESDRMLLHIMQ